VIFEEEKLWVYSPLLVESLLTIGDLLFSLGRLPEAEQAYQLAVSKCQHGPNPEGKLSNQASQKLSNFHRERKH
jgi:hypothetical protein